MYNQPKPRIVIPNVNDYRIGIPVLTASAPECEIATPRYDNSIMNLRVLKPILRRRELE